MQLIHRTQYVLPLIILKAVAMTGCEEKDERLANYAERATEQQARQNERIAQQSEAVVRQSQELASAAHQLVEQDAVARRELLTAQDKLQERHQAERTTLDRQRHELEVERRVAAQATVRDPVVARAIITAALALAALLPLLVTAYALRRLPDHLPADELLMDTLLNPLTLGQALIIPREEESDALPANPASRLPDLDDRSVCGNVNGD